MNLLQRLVQLAGHKQPQQPGLATPTRVYDQPVPTLMANLQHAQPATAAGVPDVPSPVRVQTTPSFNVVSYPYASQPSGTYGEDQTSATQALQPVSYSNNQTSINGLIQQGGRPIDLRRRFRL